MPGVLALVAACSAPPGPAASKARVAELARAAVPTPAGALSYLRAGDPAGRRVVFVHGTPGSAEGWADYLVTPPPGMEAVAVDRPGFGRSAPKRAVTSLAAQAAALAPLLVTRNGRKPIVVGHSLGGPIALRAAVDMPGRVGPLVILAGSVDPGLEKVHWAQPAGEWRLVRPLLPRAMANANRELIALKPELEALAPRLGEVRCPVIIVHGTRDPLVPYANVAFMRARLPRATVVTLRGQNHFLPWNSAAQVRAAIAMAAAAPC